VRVLALDTTGPRGSLAVASEEGPLAEARVSTGEGHSRWVLGAVDALLAGLRLRVEDLDALAVTTGPGSFTGLRVGLGTVKGLALASGRPCVGVSTLEVLAQSASAGADTVVALVGASRGDVFCGAFDADGRALREPGAGPLEDALRGLPAGAAFVGEPAAERREAIRAAAPGAQFPPWEAFLAATLARAALRRVAAGEVVAASVLRPVYLRGAHIRPSRP
jgi:tRNA threonylcarbamoyladenosine biosynthesis protein TsaB